MSFIIFPEDYVNKDNKKKVSEILHRYSIANRLVVGIDNYTKEECIKDLEELGETKIIKNIDKILLSGGFE